MKLLVEYFYDNGKVVKRLFAGESAMFLLKQARATKYYDECEKITYEFLEENANGSE
jgi:hypothetical protein